MYAHTAVVEWSRNGAPFLDNRYDRAHRWVFDGGVTVPASPSPHVVPVPMSNPAHVDPEEAFVAALASCHMLFFLSIAAKRRFVVDSYVDMATGTLEKDGSGRLAMTTVVLKPRIAFSGERQPSPDDIRKIHHLAHDACFLANSVKTVVSIELPRTEDHEDGHTGHPAP